MDPNVRPDGVTRLAEVVSRARRLRVEHLWWVLPPLLTVWMGFLHPLRRLDFWWHLKVGEIIVSERQIPSIDLFSFTRAGQPFLHQNWLAEVLYHLVHRVGDLPLLILFNTVLLLLAWLPICALCRQGQRTSRSALWGCLLASASLGMYSNTRPQSYSFVLFAVFYWILWTYHSGERDVLWMLPPLMVLWVNLHGAFVLGIGLIAIILSAEAFSWAAGGLLRSTLHRTRLKKLGIILALAILATGFNPAGLGVWRYVRQLQVDPASQAFVREWQVPDVTQLSGVLLYFGPLFLVLLVLLYADVPLSLAELGLFVVFAVLGLAAQRNGIWFSLVAAPLVGRRVAGCKWPEPLGRWLAPSDTRAKRGGRRTELPWLNWTLLFALLGFTVLLSPWVRPYLALERLRPELVEEDTPVGAADYIEAHGLQGNIFHPQGYGDYLIWRLWPQQRSFIDGRVHLFDEQLVKDYILAFQDENWEARLAKYDIQYLLLSRHDDNAQSMIGNARASERWSLLYEDEDSLLFGLARP